MISILVKFIEPAFYPVGFLWVVHVAAAIWLARKRRWIGFAGCAFVALFLNLVGSTTLPFHLLASLERPFVRDGFDQIPAGDAVVMLGGALTPSRHDVFGFEAANAIDRAITAAELIRRHKAGVLVLGGAESEPNSGPPVTESQLLGNWFKAWGVAPPATMYLPRSANTHDEALRVRAVMAEKKWKKILLVTSASHMRRARAAFVKLEIPLEAVACDFSGLGLAASPPPLGPIPRLEGFKKLDQYLHEVFGLLVYRLRGWA